MDIILASGLAFATDLSLGKITFPMLQPIVQKYHTSAPAAINAAVFGGASAVVASMITGDDVSVLKAGLAAAGGASAQLLLGGETFRMIVSKYPWMYSYLAPTYTALGVVFGMSVAELIA